jgi:DNA-binding helix-hairpin-helix protein with protein kinase domain
MTQVKLENSGHLITLVEPPLASGGEAHLHALANTDKYIAKIYHAPTGELAFKVATMISKPPDDPMRAWGHPSIAWPLERLVTPGDDPFFVGYLMPRVQNMWPIFHFYNPKTRRQVSPLFHYRYLTRTARNLAAAFAALHARGYVVGDVNESNILVSETALVTLVDTDSFQVPTDERLFRCPVGKPEFTPPELQGVHFREVDRKPEHDAFGLAVLIFMLQMEGIHPFAGRLLDGGDPEPLGQRITDGHFPYSVLRRGPYEPMPLAPPIGLLHPDIRALMRQCFEVGFSRPAGRPNATAWKQALDVAENSLVQCKVNPQHYYRTGMGSCPWCERAARLSGWDPFPTREAVASGEYMQPPVNYVPPITAAAEKK